MRLVGSPNRTLLQYSNRERTSAMISGWNTTVGVCRRMVRSWPRTVKHRETVGFVGHNCALTSWNQHSAMHSISPLCICQLYVVPYLVSCLVNVFCCLFDPPTCLYVSVVFLSTHIVLWLLWAIFLSLPCIYSNSVCPSICLSVCLFVTFWFYMKTA